MRRCPSLMVLAALALTFPAAGSIPERGRVQADILSAHVWRGLTQNDAAVLQPSATIALPLPVDIVVEGWGNLDLREHGHALRAGNMSEINASAWYQAFIGDSRLDVGITAITYHRRDKARKDTSEVFLRWTWDADPVVLSSEFYYDVDEIGGYYLRGIARYVVGVATDLDLGLMAAIGFADGDWSIGTRGGWHDYLAAMTLSFVGYDAFDVAATLSCSDTLHRKVLPSQDVNWFGGMHFSHGF